MGSMHIQDEFPPLYSTILEASSLPCLEMCFHGDSKSGEADSEDKPSQRVGVESSERLGKKGAQKKEEDLLGS